MKTISLSSGFSYPKSMKRLFDIVASGCGLIVLSPLFIILAIWIKFDSKGPVFYRQVRVGRGNKDFRIFKIRGWAPDKLWTSYKSNVLGRGN